MTQVLVISGGFSENRLFGTYQILWKSDLGGLNLVPYRLLAPSGNLVILCSDIDCLMCEFPYYAACTCNKGQLYIFDLHCNHVIVIT